MTATQPPAQQPLEQPTQQPGPAPAAGYNFPAPGPMTTGGASPRPKRWKPWVAGTLALLVGVGIGAAGGADTTQLDKANASLTSVRKTNADLTSQLSETKSQLSEAQSRTSDLTSQLATETTKAKDAMAVAVQQAMARLASKSAALQAQQTALTTRSHALDRREAKVTGMEHSWAANTIPGDGMYLVGTDVKPGVYKAGASVGCYWSRLASLDTTNIIDNNNVDGPALLQVLPSDRALELSGCATFHKVG